jgi:hypothetical protein
MASALTLDFRATLEDEKFTTTGGESDELRLQATLNWRAWRTLGVRLLVERFDRNTNSNTGVGEFEENRAFLTLAYYWGSQDPATFGSGR